MKAQEKVALIKREGFFKKGDILLLIILLILSVAITFFAFAFRQDNGGFADVYVDNVLIISLPLNEDTEYTCKTAHGINIIKIKDGKVFVSESDCGDKTCVYFGSIERKGETIYCLPHGLKITVSGDAEEGVGD